MKINDQCLTCLVNQVIKIAHITNVTDKELLYKKVFAYLSEIDFSKTNPEIIGETFQLIKKQIDNEDPYYDIRRYYNQLFLQQINTLEQKINQSSDPLSETIKYAIIANIIDFSPIHQDIDIQKWFNHIDNITLTINHIDYLKKDIQSSQSLLYLGDNCGEICLDLLLIKRIKAINPNLHIYFGVRGTPVVNDSIEEDAYLVGIDKYATVISNRDQSLGTILPRTSEAFQQIYENADVIIAKGQANYESLSEENKNIYFMLVVKCHVISQYIGIPEKSIICMKSLLENN